MVLLTILARREILLAHVAGKTMISALQKLLLNINLRGSQSRTHRDVRRLSLGAIRAKEKLAKNISEIAEVAAQHESEVTGWISADELAQGVGGFFDACDLRHWLVVADMAGVPFVPAQEVLRLSEEEAAEASGKVTVPERLRGKLRAALENAAKDLGATPNPAEPETAVDFDELREKLAAAMDDVPEGWMVRHVRGGPSSLKALAGCGLAGPVAPEVRFGADLEVGPGWARLGNRRLVDAADARFVDVYATGPGGDSVFVARPWVKAARWTVGEDPHRHGSQFAGKGMWPAEWRAYVEQDRVIGVANYYAWAGDATPEAARGALRVRDLAQAMVDKLVELRGLPAFMPHEFARGHLREVDQRLPRSHVACTLDFIEAEEGLVFLEGGPAFSRVGGGHPTAFAGVDRPEGVAFKVMPGISLAEPRTWRETDRKGAIFSWREAEVLAAS